MALKWGLEGEVIIEGMIRRRVATKPAMARRMTLRMKLKNSRLAMRGQILSIVAADLPPRAIYQYFSAMTGRRTVVRTERSPAIYYTSEQVSHFTEYLLSPYITTDLPFAEKGRS
ncbi:unnamed protein product [Didymodactylos carnosus]|uniref:Uncharacterized protein n=1 Tax=Didymodactylos carnosus TaxID=1234261 RepID=A0A815XSH8_9BILA|nr:unnamed protein product [Didymodactylos carnosus]CAF4422986.1 unnamed protein product [Didymodactylos carnosus]